MNASRNIIAGGNRFELSRSEIERAMFSPDVMKNEIMLNDIKKIEDTQRLNNAKRKYKETGDTALAKLELASANYSLASNIGDIGIAQDFSDAQLTSTLSITDEFFDFIRGGRATTMVSNRTGLANPHKDCDGVWQYTLPPTVGTTPAEDTSGACCWGVPDIMFCNDMFPISLLCLEDCEPIMDYLINANRTPSGCDLTSYFQRAGESVRDARKRLALLTMEWNTVNNLILGSLGVDTGQLKPMHGLFDVMNNEFVLNFVGTNVLSAFAQIACRLMFLNINNDSDFGIGVNHLTYVAIRQALKVDRFGNYPDGWNVNGDTITWNGIRFYRSWRIPVDLETQTGEAWIVDRSTVGMVLFTSLRPAEAYHFETFIGANASQDDCGQVCDRWYNIGGMFNTNPYHAMIVSGIPLSANCAGDALLGLDELIRPTSPLPWV